MTAPGMGPHQSPAQPVCRHLLASRVPDLGQSQGAGSSWRRGGQHRRCAPEACLWESRGRWLRTCTVQESGWATGTRTSTWRRYGGSGRARPAHCPGTHPPGLSSGPYLEHPKPPFAPSTHPMSLKSQLPLNALRISLADPQVSRPSTLYARLLASQTLKAPACVSPLV